MGFCTHDVRVWAGDRGDAAGFAPHPLAPLSSRGEGENIPPGKYLTCEYLVAEYP
jgi:hypothetical protein